MLQDRKIFEAGDRKFLVAWILLTVCFALWGFTNNVTTPMEEMFARVFRLSHIEASLMPFVFNLGYFCMALPAAYVAMRYSYKWGVVAGLALLTAGAVFVFPARWIGAFAPFLLAYFVMTCGMSFLETCCNPYFYTMGSRSTAIRRLNAVQSFNALGSLIGMATAIGVYAQTHPMASQLRRSLPNREFNLIKDHDLGALVQPYIFIGVAGLLLLVLIALRKTPADRDIHSSRSPLLILRGLWQEQNYREGLIAEFCYIGVQVTCWTYIIVYGTRIFVAEGMSEHDAVTVSQRYNMAALACFAAGRFLCTWLMRWFTPSRMLSTAGILGMAALIGVIFFTTRNGLYCLVMTSGCLSLMFPTIFGLALTDVGEHTKVASAGLVMTIVGGSILSPLQAMLIDTHLTLFGLPSTNVSFILPLLCLAVTVWYGHRTYVRYHIKSPAELS